MVFLGFYLVSSIIANNFYKIPISAAFLLASIYGIIICKGMSIEQRINIFSEGAGNKNVLLIPYVLVITLAIKGVNVTAVLTIGLVVNAIIGLIYGSMSWTLFLESIGGGIRDMGDLIIVTMLSGGIARDISKRFNIDPRKSSSILDTFSCLIQGLIPYGAQLLMASGLAGISAMSIISHLYYPFVMGVFVLGSILFRLPRRYS